MPDAIIASIPLAGLIGASGGAVVFFATPLLERFRIDDVVGAIPAHLCCGILGTLVVPLSNAEANFGVQLLGVVANGVFVFTVSMVIWTALKYTIGIRVTQEHEDLGLDIAETGAPGYPDFVPTSVMAE